MHFEQVERYSSEEFEHQFILAASDEDGGFFRLFLFKLNFQLFSVS